MSKIDRLTEIANNQYMDVAIVHEARKRLESYSAVERQHALAMLKERRKQNISDRLDRMLEGLR